MGCWNHTCAVSNLHITAGQEVFVFLLLKNHNTGDGSFCYGNALYDVVPLPFYGKYDDYGGVEECHGFGLPIILEGLKARLYKFGQGHNEYHDCEVTPENLTIEKLFEADHENRLGIQDPSRYNSDDYDIRELEKLRDEKGLTDSQQFELDRLAAKIKKVDTFRQVTHVVVHGDIAKAILEKWYIEDYVGDGKGTTGYGNNYNHIYFKDLIGFIPAYVQKKKESKEQYIRESAEAGDDPAKRQRLFRLLSKYDREDWNSPNLAARWMNYFDSAGGGNVWGLINVKECISEYVEADDWDGLAKFTHEVLTAAWINSFMSYTRKIWVKQTGQGSQNSEPLGYQVLAQATLDILHAERAEQEEWNGEDEDAEMEDEADASAG
jgi:hypothetical protein